MLRRRCFGPTMPPNDPSVSPPRVRQSLCAKEAVGSPPAPSRHCAQPADQGQRLRGFCSGLGSATGVTAANTPPECRPSRLGPTKPGRRYRHIHELDLGSGHKPFRSRVEGSEGKWPMRAGKLLPVRPSCCKSPQFLAASIAVRPGGLSAFCAVLPRRSTGRRVGR